MPPSDSSARHVVTAVIVAHDGAAWLPRLIDALGEQTTPVQRVVAVDTGSRDRSGSLLTASLGQAAVFGMDRSTGYAAAVRSAVAHKAASAPVPALAGGRDLGSGREFNGRDLGSGRDSGGDGSPSEWLWLLHDDCEPAPDALEQLLRGAADTRAAAVLGPKLMDWADRKVVTEAGLAMDTAARRITSIEPREVDQGQHDGDRDVLAVSSAGMLIRRDVWDQLGGLDPGMTLFAEDLDFCWRVHEAGYRVRVITDAVVYHAAAASRGRRAISVGRRARLLERRNGLLTLIANLPTAPMLAALAGNLTLSMLRVLFYLFAKRPTAALDETAAVLGVAGHPVRLARARRQRARGRRAAYSVLRSDLPAGGSLRRAAEFAAALAGRPSGDDLAGAHHATDDPDDDESLLTDSGMLQRALTRPGVLLTLGLIVVSIAAERSVITGGTLGGGALVPAFEGSSSLWAQFAQAYHPVGVGSGSAGPPYIGLVALLSTILLGKAWLGIDVLLLGCVPLAGVGAYVALRRVTTSEPVRIWAAAAYALLPIAFGAIAAGRLGTAVAFAAIPLIGLFAGRMLSAGGKQARRAAWATGLAVTVGTAFVPMLWPLAVAGALIALALRWRAGRWLLPDLAIAVVTPLVLLLPWLLQLLKHPAQLLLEAGLAQPGLTAGRLPARSLLLLSPGGPGLPPFWVSAALVLAGLAALIASRRRALVTAGWIVAVLGFAAAVLASRTSATSPGGQLVAAWPGTALAVAAAGLLLAAAAAADGLSGWLSRGRGQGARGARSLRVVPVILIALIAASGPLLAAAYWLMNGVTGPLRPQAGPVVPSLVSGSAGTGQQSRTLVLAPGANGTVSFLLLRGDSPEFSEPDLIPDPAAQTALTRAVSALVAPGGGEAVEQSRQLAAFDIESVLLRLPASASLIGALNGVSGLTEISRTHSFDLWRLSQPPSRVSVVEPSGAVVPVASGSIGVSGARVPAAGGTLLLSEPSGGWSASLNGHPLTRVTSPAGPWAQAFRLPPGGGTLSVSRDSLWRNLLTTLEIVLFVVVAGLALPGIRSRAELEAAAPAADSGPAPAADHGSDDSAAPSGEREAAVVTADNRDGNARSGRRSAASGRGATSGRGRRAARPGKRTATAAAASAQGADTASGTGSGGAGPDSAGPADTGAGAPRGRRAARTGSPGSADTAESATAWPAGQPVNRFVDGPPAGAGAGDETTAFVPGGAAGRRGRGGHRAGRANAPAASQREQAAPYDSRRSGDFERTDVPAAGYGQPGQRSGSRYPAGPDGDVAGYGQRAYPGDTGERDGYQGDSPYGRGSRGRPGTDLPDYREPRDAGPGYRQGSGGAEWRRDDQRSAWPVEPAPPSALPVYRRTQDQPGEPGQTRREADWPGQDRDRAWPAERDWPRDSDAREDGDYREDPPARRPRGEPRWQVPGQEPWADQDDDFGDQPSGEVHHGIEPRESRSHRWGVPARDEEGDDW